MNKTFCLGLILFASLFSIGSFAQTEAASTSTATAPKPPSVFLTYSYYKYDLQGTNNANTRIYGFDASTVDLNMVTATWLYSPQWTLLALVPHIKNMVETKYEPIPGGLNFKTRDYTEGLGDIRLMGMTALHAEQSHLVLGDVSVTLPTGSIDETFTSNPSQTAAYNMQLGSGTPDLILGATYSNTLTQWVHSVRGQITVRGGRNAKGWALGNEFLTQVSSKYRVASYFEAGVVGNYKARDAVQGRDNGYELNNNWNNVAHGDGHQYYHAPQINWDTELVAKLSTPTPFYGVIGALEGGLSFYRDAINKDDIRLDMPYWVSASVTGSF
ncbi:MAG: hypothetical protein OM95_01285 [Bdellovibrio sp. ArHS]|uniref:hypothetical protein n=1 Tax=Bdellovibrio sp. ArHS TaxID=1569284 RepID=UPI0005827C71|nr:hypothetical protein [Bdellovibrio sp. ArHS]KHD89734.1 MAG: hypothetical protein OM95_01285 [Bdellovibrio sp. ArHS]